jgi:DNA/RNA endonuclease YhcR with UshA esterase domain
MRALVFVLGLALAAVSAHAETIIAAADAPKHVGETVTVEGTVSAVHTDSRSGVTFIDMGGRYPDQTFTGVIFKADANKFPNVESLTGKVVDMTGPVHDFKGKPETILNDPAQIKTK